MRYFQEIYNHLIGNIIILLFVLLILVLANAIIIIDKLNVFKQ
jgi:hypothetical protein